MTDGGNIGSPPPLTTPIHTPDTGTAPQLPTHLSFRPPSTLEAAWSAQQGFLSIQAYPKIFDLLKDEPHLYVTVPVTGGRFRCGHDRAVVGLSVGIQHADSLCRHFRANVQKVHCPHHGMGGSRQYVITVYGAPRRPTRTYAPLRLQFIFLLRGGGQSQCTLTCTGLAIAQHAGISHSTHSNQYQREIPAGVC